MNWPDFSWWGSAASVAGLVVAVVGLAVVYRQATGAKRSADQTREAVADVLTFGSGNRAATLIQQLKDLLHKKQWEVAYYQCHTLRALIGDLRMTGVSPDEMLLINRAVERLAAMENDLDAGIRRKVEPAGVDDYNAALSQVQDTLQGILTKAAARRGGPNA